jgi:hypothetical protein
MAEALQSQKWWTRPQAVLVTLAVTLALVLALAINIDEIEDWFGATERVPVSLSLQLGKVTRVDRNNIAVALSYNKLGSARLQNCKFWMDAGELQTSGEMPEFKLARGDVAKALPVTFRLGVLRAQLSPDVTVTLSCDKASSAAATLSVRDVAADKP